MKRLIIFIIALLLVGYASKGQDEPEVRIVPTWKYMSIYYEDTYIRMSYQEFKQFEKFVDYVCDRTSSCYFDDDIISNDCNVESMMEYSSLGFSIGDSNPLPVAPIELQQAILSYNKKRNK